MPADLKGMNIRVLPSEIQRRTFELLGAVAMRMDLTEAIAMIKAGTLDAQENPLANTVTYGVHKFHKFHTLTYHFYISRPVFLHRASSTPGQPTCSAPCAGGDRSGHVSAQARGRGARPSRKTIEAAGCEILELTPQRTRRLRRRRAAAARRRAQDVRRGDVQDGGEGLACAFA